jgi:hypothetical protein
MSTSFLVVPKVTSSAPSLFRSFVLNRNGAMRSSNLEYPHSCAGDRSEFPFQHAQDPVNTLFSPRESRREGDNAFSVQLATNCVYWAKIVRDSPQTDFVQLKSEFTLHLDARLLTHSHCCFRFLQQRGRVFPKRERFPDSMEFIAKYDEAVRTEPSAGNENLTKHACALACIHQTRQNRVVSDGI